MMTVYVQVPDYHAIIKKPMDFQTMLKKCARLSYSSPQEFVDDAILVYSNAAKYNQVSGVVIRLHTLTLSLQSLDFVVEMRIFVEMKIEIAEQNIFCGEKIDKHTFFSLKIKMMDL